MEKLGDPHNGGKCVSLLPDGRILKPRTLFWEEQFLAKASRFKIMFADFERKWNMNFPLKYFPCLRFESLNGNSDEGGIVDPLPLQANRSLERYDLDNFEQLGVAIGFLAWLGVGDLHANNVCFWEDSAGKLVLVPLDVEAIFNDYRLPSQTLLLPSKAIPPCKAGLYPVLSQLALPESAEKIAAICFGYIHFFESIAPFANEIEAALLQVPGVLDVPIRIFLRATREYREHGGESNGFIPSEVEQLARGDIPYFFRRLSSEKIYYYNESGVPREAVLSDKVASAVRQDFRPLLPRGFASRNLDPLKKGGALQLARAFMKDWSGVIRFHDICIQGDEKFLGVEWGAKWRARCYPKG